MTINISKIGISTPKIAFKGKDCSSSCGETGSSSSGKGQTTSSLETDAYFNKSDPSKTIINITRGQLLKKLELYADDPLMVRIITEHLKNLG